MNFKSENKEVTQPARCLTRPEGLIEMFELKDLVSRNAPTMFLDFAGAVALVSVFIVVLTLPGFS